MAYNIVYKKSIQRDLKNLPKAEVHRILNQIEKELSENANTYPVLKGRFTGLRKYRIGDYRVIYTILEDEVLILRISHRKDVYRKKI